MLPLLLLLRVCIGKRVRLLLEGLCRLLLEGGGIEVTSVGTLHIVEERCLLLLMLLLLLLHVWLLLASAAVALLARHDRQRRGGEVAGVE